jgi:hypothetical protein
VRAVAILMALLLPGAAQALPTKTELLEAARCIGRADRGDLAGADHIRVDPNAARRRDAALEQLLTLPYSPDAAAMQAARRAGQKEPSAPPDAFASIADIVDAVDADLQCIALIERLGLAPLVYEY